MKTLSNIFLICLIIVQPVFATCDWSKDIKALPDGTFAYSAECHKKVGDLVKGNQNQTQQVSDLNKALSMKDLALQTADKRAQLWSDTSAKLEDRLQKVDSLQQENRWIYFGLGVATTFLAGFAAAKLAGH